MNRSEKTMPIVPCPKCRTTTTVRPKLIATNFAVHSAYGFYEPYEVADEAKYDSSPFTHHDYFISALYCSACDVGFIPGAMLPELGLRSSTSRPGARDNIRPFGIGYPAPDPS